MEEILEELLSRGQAFATFSAIEKILPGCKKSFRGPYVVQAWASINKMYSSMHT